MRIRIAVAIRAFNLRERHGVDARDERGHDGVRSGAGASTPSGSMARTE